MIVDAFIGTSEGVGFVPIGAEVLMVFYAQCGGQCDCMGCVGVQVSVEDVGVWVSDGCGYM